MNFRHILITGGAGFVGSNLAIGLKLEFPEAVVTSLDNLKRRGSELNLARLDEAGVKFIHGDIRNQEDLEAINGVDLIIECSAEPSVLAGVNSSPAYLLNTNLLGTINCLELARIRHAAVMFISTSRVYPIAAINNLKFAETETRFVLAKKQKITGVSARGISEAFPLDGARSLYGTTKLASELLLQEYGETYGIQAIINRCGLITGPWQMGKVDQGVIALWVARHLFGGNLGYIGYGGEGKQVRDFVHIEDLADLVIRQVSDFKRYNGEIYNVGGGTKNSISLQELTRVCEQVTGKKIKIKHQAGTRPADLKWYVTDATKITQVSGWQQKRDITQTITDIASWMSDNQARLKHIL